MQYDANGALLTTEIPGVKLVNRGKVRDVYDLGDALLFVATDRISAFDVVMPCGVPRKGEVLTQISLFWFDLMRDIPNHLISADVTTRPELAAACDVPVVIHTGDTAGTRGHVKYAHPLTVDEVAVDFPKTRFVLAHYGNPWIVDATEVAAKNENVSIDLSGLAAGTIDAAVFLKQFRGYLEHMRVWMDYLGDWSRFLYGSDYPLVNIGEYIKVIRAIVPEEHHEAVFCNNALRVFPKLKLLLKAEEEK